jgi:hypothetical protein
MRIHPFLTRCSNVHELLGDVFTISQFINNVEKQSGSNILYPANDFKGDATEYLVSEIFALHPVDNIFGISEYQMIRRTDDMGADGKGINQSLNECLAQVKWRRPNYFLNYNKDHLNNIFNVGDELGINSDSIGDGTNYKYHIITLGAGLDHQTDKNFNGKRKRVRCFCYNDFKVRLDDNGPFWKSLRERAFQNQLENVVG